MTERRQKAKSAIVYGSSGVSPVGLNMALYEELFKSIGSTDFADFIAERLRDSPPSPAILEMVARWLDPKGDDFFKLVVVRRRRGKSWTKKANDLAIGEAFAERKRALGGKHGNLKKAVGEIADQFGVSSAKVRKIMRSIRI
jgi:hypothetical protein